jgi:two-component system, OmpR family, response regulator
VLVLSRRLNESIVLPGLGITVRVVAVKAGVVRLGIEAPPDVPVLREELVDQSHVSGGTPAGRATPELCSV